MCQAHLDTSSTTFKKNARSIFSRSFIGRPNPLQRSVLVMNRDGLIISTIRKNSFIFAVNSHNSSSSSGKRYVSIVK